MAGIFGSGVMIHEVFIHAWFIFDGMLPLRSNLLQFTLTKEINSIAIILDTFVLIIFVYFGWIRKYV